MNLRITVDDRDGWLQLYERLQSVGLLRDISREDMDLDKDLFPMEFFIDIDPILGLIENPVVRPFKKKIDSVLTRGLEEAIL